MTPAEVDAFLGARRTKTEERLESFRTAFRRDFRPGEEDELIGQHTCLYAVGSGGRGEMSAHSDLDLFIVRDGTPRRMDEVRLQSAIVRALTTLGLPPPSQDATFLKLHSADSLIERLTPGVWKDITPSTIDFAGTFGANSIDLDPSNPWSLYASIDQRGIWKSTDGGGSFKRLGEPASMGNDTSGYLDSPLRVAVDPCDPTHLYSTQGVRGATQGFWISHDGGTTWARPQGFIDIAKTTTNDVTTLAVDPVNFGHILLGAHSAWPGRDDAGIFESKDGGQTWVTRAPASGGFQSGSVGIGFAFDPALGIGDSNTWVVNGDSARTWRTSDGGATWTKVSDLSGVHGGAELYRDSKGALYFGGYQYPARSTDNGVTWAQVSTGLQYASYMSMVGDGKNLYTGPSCACGGSPYNQSYFTSLETDGKTWTAYQGGAQKTGNGPYRMRFDKVNRIIYSANWLSGLWALRVID
jgi:hypothetical protein